MRPTDRRLRSWLTLASLSRLKPDSHGFEGRSHSLWYCDAQEAGVFRWYEMAFMIMPSIPKRGRIDPFALSPGRDAYVALSPVMGELPSCLAVRPD